MGRALKPTFHINPTTRHVHQPHRINSQTDFLGLTTFTKSKFKYVVNLLFILLGKARLNLEYQPIKLLLFNHELHHEQSCQIQNKGPKKATLTQSY